MDLYGLRACRHGERRRKAGTSSTPQVEPPLAAHEFTFASPATRLSASLARRAAVARLDDWDVPPGSPLSDTVALLVAELAADAARQGRAAGRNFELRLLLHTHPRPVAEPTTVASSRR
ncbi:hypothetical protein JGS22_025625 [Streptomyces sp. P38-E01]|uniref:Uncharacterized protein n=1 Tax=Streptomyces tardus TaxID=2780544 RepID=A0A949JIR4_9ACTN|nr:hypothetical protein [Streptomyces tardus]MBU7600908.1 hypothetical protein [Streptomyces tardus]